MSKIKFTNKERCYIADRFVYDDCEVNLTWDMPGFMGPDKFILYLESLNDYTEPEPDPMDPFIIPMSFETFFKDKLEENGFDRSFRS